MLSVENKSSQPQAVNDKNCYIISPCKVLENHVRNIKSFKIDEYEEYRLFQDSAFIVLTSLKTSYTEQPKQDKPILTKGNEPINLNELVNKPEPTQPAQQPQDDVVEIDVEPEIYPADVLEKELQDRGLTSNECERIITRLSPQQIEQVLNDPSAIDALVEQVKG